MIFLGCLFERQKEKMYVQRSKGGISNAVNGYQWNLINGFNAVADEPVDLINVLPVGTWPKQYKQLLLRTRRWSYEGSRNLEVGCLNLPFIKQYQRYRKCLKALRKSKDKNILIYSTYLPFLKAVWKLDRSYHVTLVVTDLPEFYDLGKTNAIRRFFRKRNNKKIYRCLKRIDKFVLLTEQMKEPLQVGDRPYTVVEGICDPHLFDATNEAPHAQKPCEKTVLYTGTLHRKFGILNLLDAFSQIESEDYRLWICGGGDAQEQISRAAERDKRIEFFGFQPKDRINELQQKATVLVNPRQNNEAFTKYSFPSKTMEYMLSGKPVIMYKLDGIPNEYDSYLQYVDGDAPCALKNKIVEVCEWSEEKRHAIGEAARDFVICNKNCSVQAKRILDLMGS